MTGNKRRGNGTGSRIATVIIGALITLCSLIPVAESLFGQTGYITEIRSSSRVGGELAGGELPNTYRWSVGYTFRTESGEYHTGSVSVKGDAVSSRSGLKVGSPVRYLPFAPNFNHPGQGMSVTLMYLFLAAFGVFMITLRKPKPAKTPAQRSREYRAAEAARPPAAAPPDWEAMEFDDNTPLTEAEANELYTLASQEEVEDEFDLINAVDEGPGYYRQALAIVRWRRANGL